MLLPLQKAFSRRTAIPGEIALFPERTLLSAWGRDRGPGPRTASPRWSETVLPPSRVRALNGFGAAGTESSPEREGVP
jgi:hypothetical protein